MNDKQKSEIDDARQRRNAMRKRSYEANTGSDGRPRVDDKRFEY